MNVVTFDLDDTLYSERDYVASGLRAAGDELDKRVGLQGSGEALWQAWCATGGREVFQTLLARVGLPDTQWLPLLQNVYRNHRPQLQLRPGVLDVISGLRKTGHLLALISDGSADAQRRKWQSLDIAKLFSAVLFTDDKGREYWKPNSWAFEEIERILPRANHYVYVADNIEKDFIAPNQLGWITVRLRHPDNVHRPPSAPSPLARPQHDLDGIDRLMSTLEW